MPEKTIIAKRSGRKIKIYNSLQEMLENGEDSGYIFSVNYSEEEIEETLYQY